MKKYGKFAALIVVILGTLVWLATAEWLYQSLFGYGSPESITQFLRDILTTREGWILIIAGFSVIGAGWAGVQSTPVVAVQLAYLASGGVAGIALIIVGAARQVIGDLRAVRAGMEELLNRADDLEHDLADTKEWVRALEVRRIQELAVVDGAASRVGL